MFYFISCFSDLDVADLQRHAYRGAHEVYGLAVLILESEFYLIKVVGQHFVLMLGIRSQH